MVKAKCSDALDLLAGVNGTRGVVGVAKENKARARAQHGFEGLAAGKVKALLAPALDRNEFHSGHRRERAVVRIERLGDDHFVAHLRETQEREEDRFAASRGGDQMARFNLQAHRLVVAAQGGEVLRCARGGRVGDDGVNGLQTVPHDLGGFEIGLADVQMKDLHAPRLGRLRVGRELANGRGRQGQATGRNFGHACKDLHALRGFSLRLSPFCAFGFPEPSLF